MSKIIEFLKIKNILFFIEIEVLNAFFKFCKKFRIQAQSYSKINKTGKNTKKILSLFIFNFQKVRKKDDF